MKGTAWVLLALLLAGCGATDSEGVADTGGGSGGDSGGGTGGGDSGDNGGNNGGGSVDTLSAQYPGDAGIASDPDVLFFDDFESGWGRWDWPKQDTRYLTLETNAANSHSGSRYLRSSVSEGDLVVDNYISASTGKTFEKQSDVMYVRFYAQFVDVAPKPGHWVRFSAKSYNWNSSGLANTVPPGDGGFWWDLDVTKGDDFMFYAYWHDMRSGRCNDGSATPGCEGDQGTTYYYGNVFHPPGQQALQRDQWLCIEVMGKANTVGESDGELGLWVNEELIERYRPGNPVGSWLRAAFYHEGECKYSSCPDPVPFEGFNFRSSNQVKFGQFFLDAYNELASFRRDLDRLRNEGKNPSSTQNVLYDDVVVATRSVGCRQD
jgi:hypothetical protein